MLYYKTQTSSIFELQMLSFGLTSLSSFFPTFPLDSTNISNLISGGTNLFLFFIVDVAVVVVEVVVVVVGALVVEEVVDVIVVVGAFSSKYCFSSSLELYLSLNKILTLVPARNLDGKIAK